MVWISTLCTTQIRNSWENERPLGMNCCLPIRRLVQCNDAKNVHPSYTSRAELQVQPRCTRGNVPIADGFYRISYGCGRCDVVLLTPKSQRSQTQSRSSTGPVQDKQTSARTLHHAAAVNISLRGTKWDRTSPRRVLQAPCSLFCPQTAHPNSPKGAIQHLTPLPQALLALLTWGLTLRKCSFRRSCSGDRAVWEPRTSTGAQSEPTEKQMWSAFVLLILINYPNEKYEIKPFVSRYLLALLSSMTGQTRNRNGGGDGGTRANKLRLPSNSD